MAAAGRRRSSSARSPGGCAAGALGLLARSLSVTGCCGVGHYSASNYGGAGGGGPGLQHFLFVWKATRQYTMPRPPAAAESVAGRKALLRVYSSAYDKLTGVPLPPPGLRSFSASYPGLDGLAHVAGHACSSSITLAVFDGSVSPASLEKAVERLAKALKKDVDRLLCTSPGVL